MFQSTHPHGVRHKGSFMFNSANISFNPRTHTGCDTAPLNTAAFVRMFQSTHPHGVRRKLLNDKDTNLSVSIHAPTRGATKSQGVSDIVANVSIHAPTRGATRICASSLATISVSIHAPTRGATRQRSGITIASVCFNPRTHTGCDSNYDIVLGDFNKVSIHAPTRGATQRIGD